MAIKTPRLRQNRLGVFCFRFLYIDATGKRREAVRSLGTKDPDAARVIALRLNFEHEQRRQMTRRLPNPADFIDPLKMTLADGTTFDGETAEVMEAVKAYKAQYGVFPPIQAAMAWREGVSLPPPEKVAQIASKPVAEVMASYLKDKQGENTPEVLKMKTRIFEHFKAFFEDDGLTLAQVSKERAQNWKERLKATGQTLNTVNDKISVMVSLFKFAIEQNWTTANPFDGLRIKWKIADGKAEPWEDFSADDLKKIFVPADYKKRFGKRPDNYFLPLLALYTGARREELGSLRTADLMTVDGLPVVFIQGGKTKDARRKVPIHSALIALGFLDYVEAVRTTGETYLFPNKRKAGGKGATAGAMFGKHLKAIGLQDGRKVFHSFRHTVSTKLVKYPDHSRVIVGHAQGDVHGKTYVHLQTEEGLRELAEVMERLLSYPIDLAALKMPDPTFAQFLKDWKAGAAHRARLAQSRAKNAAAKAARDVIQSPQNQGVTI
jgi:integrase